MKECINMMYLWFRVRVVYPVWYEMAILGPEPGKEHFRDARTISVPDAGFALKPTGGTEGK
jgi:hypothetical protein